MSDVALPGRRRLDLGSAVATRARDLVRSPRYTLVRRACLALVLISLAFHYTLDTLVRTLSDETPLAYLGLVPVIALLLAAARIRPQVREPAIHDRQVDYIIGLPLIMSALIFNVLMPIQMSTLFWLYRLDLVAFPMFVAGVICLLFGVRVLWRLKIPVLFLILAWPLPYTTLLINWLNAFTNSTLHGLNFMLGFAHVATAEPSQGVGTYLVKYGTNGRSSFPVSVASACSGVNGIVGYLMVAVAFLTVVTGSWARKGIWLAFGLVGVWATNVLRIFAILVVGSKWGETLAIDILHPVAGLLMFNLVVLVMVLTMGRFGLAMQFGGDTKVDVNAHVRQAVPKIRLAVGIVAAFVLVAYVSNSSLRQFDLVVSDLGAPRLVSFSDSPSHPVGWDVVKTDVYTWAKPFFGNDSTWYRYQFTWTGDPKSDLKANVPIIADVINTSDVTSFNTYGIEACYRFHGYKLYSIRTVDLGEGVVGNVLAYYNTSAKSDWTTVYFHWPVKTQDGKTRYERVTLMIINANDATFTGPTPSSSITRSLGLSVHNALYGQGSSSAIDAHFDKTREFLVQFARALVQTQASSSTATPVAHSTPTTLLSASSH
jgi:exosortase/archaeosortase family protein